MDERIRVADGPGGAVVYQVQGSAADLPPVRSGDLHDAWYHARQAAHGGQRGEARVIRFEHADGPVDIALTDRDACCWSRAVDEQRSLATRYGLSLCLRLLALIDLLAHAPWARALLHLARDGAEFHPALLRAAASQPLTREARFDEAGFQRRLSRFVSGFQLDAPRPIQRLSGT
jgi:hypothetical protein